MGGGLMQLVAYGAQDVYLTGSPQITFFKVVYRRHTNFSVEGIQQTFNGNADYGRTVTCSVNRNGDLITKVYLVVEDEGPGFNEKNINQVFERFYSNRPEKFGKHSGLGLNIVKNITELHGGEIKVSNRMKKGARIEIQFPSYVT